MKVNMDLLPSNFKCIPRAWLGIYILIVMILLNAGLHFGLDYWYKSDLASMSKLSKDKLESKKKVVKTLKIKIGQRKATLERVTLPPEEILNINKQIEFFNKIYGKTFSWYDYFDAVEKFTPSSVWIKQIKINPEKSITEQWFELNCESTESYHAPGFLKNLMRYRDFAGPPGMKDVHLSQVLKTPEGGHEFAIKFKFLPIKEYWVVKPGAEKKRYVHNENIEVKLGQTISLRLRGRNIAGDTIFFNPTHYKVEPSDQGVGKWDQYKEMFTGMAPGMCSLIFQSVDLKHLITVDMEVR